jgi:hypothetical protein
MLYRMIITKKNEQVLKRIRDDDVFKECLSATEGMINEFGTLDFRLIIGARAYISVHCPSLGLFNEFKETRVIDLPNGNDFFMIRHYSIKLFSKSNRCSYK